MTTTTTTTISTSQHPTADSNQPTSSSIHEIQDQNIKINESTHLCITIRWAVPAAAANREDRPAVDLEPTVLIMLGGV